MQGEFPAGLALPALSIPLGGGPGGSLHVLRQARQFGLVGHEFGEGVGGVQQVFRELGGEAGQFFLDGLEAGLLVFRQFGAGKAEVADLVVQDSLAGRGKAGEFGGGGQGLVLLEEGQVLAQFAEEAGHLRQQVVVGLAPFGHVIDAVQVADDAPGPGEVLDAVVEGRREIVPGGRHGGGGEARHQGPAVGQQLLDGGPHVGRLDAVEGRQHGTGLADGGKKGIGAHGLFSGDVIGGGNKNGRPGPPVGWR